MSFVKNDNQQLTLLDSTFNLTEREKRMLEKSWAKTFADKVFPAIDENIFSVLYSKKASQPNTPVNVIVGALILKEALHVTDDEIVKAMAFDIRYQYALHTTSFEEQPISDRTLSRFRARVLSYETEHDVDDTSEYQLLIRLLKERTIIDDDGSRRLQQKEEVENPSEVLLNTSEPEATFKYKAGGKHLGYVGNIVESVGENGSLIIDYDYQQNTYADNQFMKDYLNRKKDFSDGSFLVADGAYSG